MWKDYKELEDSLSMPELTSILAAKRDKEYSERKFLAALQGVDLDDAGEGEGDNPQKAWEDMKARVFSGGAATDSNDITSLQGFSAEQAGFGIGQGLNYEKATDSGSLMI